MRSVSIDGPAQASRVAASGFAGSEYLASFFFHWYRRRYLDRGPEVFYAPLQHQDDPSASHLPDSTADGTRRSPGEPEPPSEGAKPALRQIEHGRFPVPPADEELEAGRHEPEGRIEFERKLRPG